MKTERWFSCDGCLANGLIVFHIGVIPSLAEVCSVVAKNLFGASDKEIALSVIPGQALNAPPNLEVLGLSDVDEDKKRFCRTLADLKDEAVKNFPGVSLDSVFVEHRDEDGFGERYRIILSGSVGVRQAA